MELGPAVASQDFIDRSGMHAEADRESVVVKRCARNVEFSDRPHIVMGKRRRLAAPQVLRVGHWLKVFGIDARRNTTEMVKVISVGYGSTRSGVGLAVSERTALNPCAVLERPVPMPIGSSLPYPTTSHVSTVLLSPQIGTPLNDGLDSLGVSSDETERLPLDPSEMSVVARNAQSELAASALTKFRRLFSHAGLLHRLTLGERRSLRRSPHSIAWGS